MLPLLLLLAALSARPASSFAFSGESAVLVLPANASAAARLALRDVQRDLYKVTGFVVAPLTQAPARGSLPPGTTVVFLLTQADAAPAALDTAACFAGAEAHCVLAAADGGSGYPVVYASGSTDRGAIFAWYAFSEAVLGVNPLYRFTDDPPAFRAAPIDVADGLALTFAPPKFKVRSWFVNDEDLLGGHRADPAGEAVFDLVMWDAICETLLRIKGNAMIPGTNPFPDESSLRLVARRGLIVMSHHYDLLGLNVFKWPLGARDWDWAKNTATMSMVWKASVAAQVALGGEVIWSLGLRGLNDYDYPCASPRVCGQLISEAMGNQSQWVDEIAGPGQTKILYLWDELFELLTDGFLTLPAGVQIVVTDSGAGFINVNSNVSQYAHGVYYHTVSSFPNCGSRSSSARSLRPLLTTLPRPPQAMYNGGANQLGEMVPADRIFTQFARFFNYSVASNIVIDNLSDIRPALMTSEALMRMAWDPAPYVSGDPNATALAFYSAWGARQAGLAPADAATFGAAWRDYFATPFIQSGRADNVLANLISDVCTVAGADLQKNGTVSAGAVAKAAGALAQIGGSATPSALLGLLDRVKALQASVPAARQPFFAGHTLVGMASTAQPAQAVMLISTALAAIASGDKATAAAALDGALAAMDDLMSLRRTGEYGQWHGFWFSDHLSDLQRARKYIKQVQVALASAVGAPLVPTTPYIWYVDFESYLDERFEPNYPLMHFDARYNLATYVRINCVWGDVDAASCFNTPSGGAFVAGAGAAATLQIMTSLTVPGAAADAPTLVIRYTLDGSVPTASSPPYVAGAPVQLDKAAVGGVATIRALAFTSAGAPAAAQTTDAVYVQR